MAHPSDIPADGNCRARETPAPSSSQRLLCALRVGARLVGSGLSLAGRAVIEFVFRPLAGSIGDARKSALNIRHPLTAVTVGRVMTVPVECIPESMPLWRLIERQERTGRTRFPVVDESGRLAGLVTDANLPESPGREVLGWLIAADVMQAAPIAVAYAHETVAEVSRRLLQCGTGCLPVVDRDQPGRLVGFLTQTDLLKALTAEAAHNEAA